MVSRVYEITYYISYASHLYLFLLSLRKLVDNAVISFIHLFIHSYAE